MIVVLLILNIISLVRIGRLRAKLRAMLGHTGRQTLEDAIIRSHEHISELHDQQIKVGQQLDSIIDQMRQMKARTAISRYNAFHETGSDLSFSIAIVDGNGNGLVLTGIHTRHDTQIYAKPLERGRSTYALSPEEEEVISQALRT